MTHWTVTFRLKLGREGVDGVAPAMNALQERGWRPKLSDPDSGGWRIAACHDVEAESGEQAAGLVAHVAINATPAQPLDRRYDSFDVDRCWVGHDEFGHAGEGLAGKAEPVGGTWTGAGEPDDFTVEPAVPWLEAVGFKVIVDERVRGVVALSTSTDPDGVVTLHIDPIA